MLGHQLYRTLSNACETHVTLRSYGDRLRQLQVFDEARVHVGVDGLDVTAVADVLRAFRPEWVINCIGSSSNSRRQRTQNAASQ